MEAGDLTVSSKTQLRPSLWRQAWKRLMLGGGIFAAFGGGLLYGAADAETIQVTQQLAFSGQLHGSITKAMASLPAPDIVSIVFGLQSDDGAEQEAFLQLEEPPSDGQREILPADYYCLPTPLEPVNNLGQDLSSLGTQVNQSSQRQVSSWVSHISAQLEGVKWPNIHERSQMARVPVIMYHDVLPEKEVFFDITPERLNADFRKLKENNLTPISLDQLVNHLRTGVPLPEKPVVLTFAV